jgi:nuclear cap-binding protein subunit 1
VIDIEEHRAEHEFHVKFYNFILAERRQKRRRMSTSENQEIEDRLESLILRVGEKSTSSLESNLEGLVSVLEADLGTFRNKILRILSDCAIKMPGKMSQHIS